MDFKPAEIAAIVLAFLVPVAIFAVVLTPGALGAIYAFAFDRQNMPFVFGGGALLTFGVLAYRIFRRIRPGPGKPGNPAAESRFDRPRGPRNLP
ncbi:MAG: hypothetical protein SGJ21_10630 [Alphaproteobacteria bacterium]|nr:hypothetical protein [Alphaproteobacteria bacterium]